METEVITAVQRYVDGCARADAALVLRAFDANAVMWGYLGETYTTMSGVEFAEQVIATAEPAGSGYHSEIHSVRVDGVVATAVLDERGFLGANFRNHFGLILRDGEWRITSKLFTTV